MNVDHNMFSIKPLKPRKLDGLTATIVIKICRSKLLHFKYNILGVYMYPNCVCQHIKFICLLK